MVLRVVARALCGVVKKSAIFENFLEVIEGVPFLVRPVYFPFRFTQFNTLLVRNKNGN